MGVMQKATLCFPLKGDSVLLGFKKEGFGEGYFNGFGGKIKEGESIEEATVRELYEEAGLYAEEEHLKKCACIKFYFAGKLKFEVYAFLIKMWLGDPRESREMKPCWYHRDTLPFDTMWPADREWIPLVLSGMKIKGEVHFNERGDIVEQFNWEETKKL